MAPAARPLPLRAALIALLLALAAPQLRALDAGADVAVAPADPAPDAALPVRAPARAAALRGAAARLAALLFGWGQT